MITNNESAYFVYNESGVEKNLPVALIKRTAASRHPIFFKVEPMDAEEIADLINQGAEKGE